MSSQKYFEFSGGEYIEHKKISCGDHEKCPYLFLAKCRSHLSLLILYEVPIIVYRELLYPTDVLPFLMPNFF